MITIVTQYFLSDHPWLLPCGYDPAPPSTLPQGKETCFYQPYTNSVALARIPLIPIYGRSGHQSFDLWLLDWVDIDVFFHKPLPKFHLCCVVELSRLSASSETIGVCNAGNGTWCLRRISVLPDHFWQGFLAAIRVEPGHDLVRLTGCCD